MPTRAHQKKSRDENEGKSCPAGSAEEKTGSHREAESREKSCADKAHDKENRSIDKTGNG